MPIEHAMLLLTLSDLNARVYRYTVPCASAQHRLITLLSASLFLRLLIYVSHLYIHKKMSPH